MQSWLQFKFDCEIIQRIGERCPNHYRIERRPDAGESLLCSLSPLSCSSPSLSLSLLYKGKSQCSFSFLLHLYLTFQSFQSGPLPCTAQRFCQVHFCDAERCQEYWTIVYTHNTDRHTHTESSRNVKVYVRQ